jgi:parallel beta-helix repeat protein
VPAGKNNLTLQSKTKLTAIIKAPAVMTMPKAIVRVTTSTNVTIQDFTITGPGGGGCGSIEYGVRVDGGGSAKITGNHITMIEDSPFGGCQSGVGILVGRAAESTTGSATIQKNTIDNYQKNGITVSNAGSSATIEDNDVIGAGPTAVNGQNGVQISSGATATLKHNAVSGNQYSPQSVAAAGILLISPGAVSVDDNNIVSNDVGIYATPAGGLNVKNNDISHSTFDGIAIVNSSGGTYQSNRSHDNGGPGIGLYGTSGVTLKNNKLDDNAGDGIAVDADSSDNVIQDNKAGGNSPVDCEDDSTGAGTAGTANTWKNDHGGTQSRDGLCKGATTVDLGGDDA